MLYSKFIQIQISQNKKFHEIKFNRKKSLIPYKYEFKVDANPRLA